MKDELFKKYVGTKTIEAVPMSKKDAEEYLKREIKSKHSAQDEDEDGYLVKYEDGYESWSPKEVLGKAFKLADLMQAEFDELCEKFKGLVNYMYSDEGKALSDNDRNCHDRRMKYMKDLLDSTEICLYNAKEDVYLKADQARKAEAALAAQRSNNAKLNPRKHRKALKNALGHEKVEGKFS